MSYQSTIFMECNRSADPHKGNFIQQVQICFKLHLHSIYSFYHYKIECLKPAKMYGGRTVYYFYGVATPLICYIPSHPLRLSLMAAINTSSGPPRTPASLRRSAAHCLWSPLPFSTILLPSIPGGSHGRCRGQASEPRD